MSLKSAEIRTDLGSGHEYYQYIRLDLKLHRLDTFSNSALVSFLYSGSPMRLTYGWNSPNTFLNEKATLMFNVVDYVVSIDEAGQSDLVINGTAFNDHFVSSYIGDIGQDIKNGMGKNAEAIRIFTKLLNEDRRIYCFLYTRSVKSVVYR